MYVSNANDAFKLTKKSQIKLQWLDGFQGEIIQVHERTSERSLDATIKRTCAASANQVHVNLPYNKANKHRYM